jgi:O-acetyl-ADP-ribose deacetylase (regulator of RNase III)
MNILTPDKLKIEMVKGDILNAKDPVIAHCCNIRNTMRAGVAEALRRRFPEIYEKDKEVYIGYGRKLLGHCEVVPVSSDPGTTFIKQVANLYAQPTYGNCGRYVNYEALYESLEGLRTYMLLHTDYHSIGMPYKIACERAGGDWNIVYAMLQTVFINTGITLNYYKL